MNLIDVILKSMPLSLRCKLLLLIPVLFSASLPAFTQTQKDAVSVIFDTDMGPDYDDVGAITLLHAFADKGEAKILATIASTKYDNVGAVLSILNTYFKRPDVPIGVPRGQALTLRDKQYWSDSLVARYKHSIKSNDQTADAVKLYRQILSKQPDNSVTIITVGFLTNISNLLQSKGDEFSKLSGEELINKKVVKLVSMAGKFPSGSEFNVREDAEASRYVFENFKPPIILSGFEIGANIKSGLPLIRNNKIRNSPVKDVFRISIPLDDEDKDGRMSWDQTAVLVAVRGEKPFYGLSCGKMVVAQNGSNTWSKDGKTHCHLVEQQPSNVVEKLINDLMMHQPQ